MMDYLDIPFKDHGRDRSGCDCFGLVRLVLMEQYGITLPSLVEGYKDTEDRSVIAGLIDIAKPLLDFTMVNADGPLPGDVVVIRQGGQPCHVGIMVGPNSMLHTEAGSGPKFEDIRRPHLAPRIEGFYRHD